MSEIDKDQKEELRQLGERAHWAYERHRNLGVALMATILGLSGGGLVILGRDKNPFAALYIVPILLAVLQQHLTYQASRHLSRGQNLTMRLFVEQPTLDAAPSGTSPQRDGMRQQMNYEFEMESAYSGQAHRISVLTVYAFILFTLVCVGFIYMASVAISFLAVLILSSLLGTGFEIGRGGKKIWGTPGHIVVPLKARGTKFDYKRESERKTFTRLNRPP